MGNLSELRVSIHKKKTLLEKYIDIYLDGNEENLTIKEDWFMLEQLKAQREAYVAELEQLKLTDLEEEKNKRFESVKASIAEEVEAELASKVSDVESKIKNYDIVIADFEAKAVVELTVNEADVVGLEEVDEIPEGANVVDVVNIVEE